ncbi:MAG: ribonuclease H-like domain-containing protein [Planctomycetota bacterium]|nr:ribonuclease H-like domain-containing protein [Planctomycetota bacterium]
MGSGQESARGKLARLRREGTEGASVRPVVPRRGVPDWLTGHLDRRAAPRPTSPAPAGIVSEDHGWERTSGDPARLSVESGRLGTYAVRREEVPVPGLSHGSFSLAEVDHADPRVIARLACDPGLDSIDLRRAVFLDTETTGLAGGAGVYVYMVGLGWFEGDRYVSWQGFLRSPGEEAAMLEAVAEIVGGADHLVSFFGKSFDRHRLEDKMRIVGVAPPFDGRPHLDLYHPMRRLTRGALKDGKLQTMERELLGFERARDLPGSLAPAAWFDYLGGRPHLLEGVFEHNREDVLTLTVLAAYLGRAERERRADGGALPGPLAQRARALMETSSSREEELGWAEAALQRGLEGEDRRRVLVVRAHLLRRLGRVDAARGAYREALEESAEDLAAVELFVGASMLLERPLGDLVNALAMAERASRLAGELGRPRSVLAELERRIGRLAGATSR